MYVAYRLEEPEPRTGGLAVGIDRGVTNPTTIARSDGRVDCYDTASVFRENAHAADKERRRTAKSNARSKRHAKRQAAQSARKRDWANARDYAEWLLVKEICEGASVVCFERLYIEAMTRHGGRRKAGLNRAMRFVRHAEVRRKVEVVAARRGIRIVDVDPRRTSQECHMCGHTDRENRQGERFECLGCGHTDNADGNAARNILCRGTGIKVPAVEGIALERRELGRTRNKPAWVHAAPDGGARDKRETVRWKAPKSIWEGTRTSRSRTQVYNSQFRPSLTIPSGSLLYPRAGHACGLCPPPMQHRLMRPRFWTGRIRLGIRLRWRGVVWLAPPRSRARTTWWSLMVRGGRRRCCGVRIIPSSYTTPH